MRKVILIFFVLKDSALASVHVVYSFGLKDIAGLLISVTYHSHIMIKYQNRMVQFSEGKYDVNK